MNETFNVAETFYSIKGEGKHAGTPMYFLRLAGCNIGKICEDARLKVHRTGGLPRICTSWSGTEFYCDTYFGSTKQMTVDDVILDMNKTAGVDIRWLVLTGGEPLLEANIQAVWKLYDKLWRQAVPKRLHIETNGTQAIPDFLDDQIAVYIACSPKVGWKKETIERADELRLLITSSTKDEDFPKEFLIHPRVSLSPYNPYYGGLNDDSLQNCLHLLKLHPNWRLNLQLHKYINIP